MNDYRMYAVHDGVITEVYDEADDIRFGEIYVKSGDTFYAIWGSVTKDTASTFDAIPSQAHCAKLWDKLPINTGKVIKILEASNSARVYLYGTGRHTEALMTDLPEQYKESISGILDKNELEKTCFGLQPCNLTDLKSGDVIIISSYFFQNTIYNRLEGLKQKGIEIIKLY